MLTKWLRCGLIFVLIFSVCDSSHVTNTFQYEASNLSADDISMHVRSDITGSITYVYTDEPLLAIVVKISASTIDHINNTEITFLSDANSVQLFVRDQPVATAHAPITGTGSKLFVPQFLPWISAAVVFDWKPVYVAMCVILCSQSVSHASQMEPEQKTVQIEIRAPRRFQYTDFQLYVKDGTINVEDFTPGQITTPMCRTGHATEGCPSCCHGHGMCVKDECVCQEEYDHTSFCEKRKRLDIFYSHPLDPRLETVILPTGASLTLSRSYNTPEAEVLPFLPYRDNVVISVHDRETNMITHRIRFSTDGFIEQIEDFSTYKVNKIRFKRSRVDKCKINAVFINGDTESKYSINTCVNNPDVESSENTNVLQSPSATNNVRGRRMKSLRRHKRKQRHNSSRKTFSSIDIIKVPVSTERCGSSVEEQPQVYLKVTPLQKLQNLYRSNDPEIDNNPGDLEQRMSSSHVYQSVVLSGERDSSGGSVIYLPDIQRPLGTESVNAKCGETSSKHIEVCSSSRQRVYSRICSSLSSNQDVTVDNLTPTHTNSSIIQYSNSCHFVVQLLNTFCDRKAAEVLSKENNCHLQYSSSVNLFTVEYFEISAYAVYSDGKTVKGSEHRLFLRDAKDILRNGITMVDKKPDFRIDRVSVIPKDPVPLDIYQVKLDYSCATNSTIIRMTVTGSDKYSNHVTCHGVSGSGSCTLHAAGAPDAVVDNVSIKVTDPHTGTDLTKDMVVIF